MSQSRRNTRPAIYQPKQNGGNIPPIEIALDLIDIPRAVQIACEPIKIQLKYCGKLVTKSVHLPDSPKCAI